MKILAINILLVVLIVAISLTLLSRTAGGKRFRSVHLPAKETNTTPSPIIRKLNLKASNAKAFAKKMNFNTSFCFLIDMSLSSNQKRFFIYDLQKDTIVNSGLVGHGNCNQYWL